MYKIIEAKVIEAIEDALDHKQYDAIKNIAGDPELYSTHADKVEILINVLVDRLESNDIIIAKLKKTA